MNTFKVGDLIKIKTKTFNDVFGEVVYKCNRDDVPLANGGIGCEFEIVSGTGAAARAGFIIVDTRKNMEKCINDGIAEVVNGLKDKTKTQKTSTFSGIIECDL